MKITGRCGRLTEYGVAVALAVALAGGLEYPPLTYERADGPGSEQADGPGQEQAD